MVKRDSKEKINLNREKLRVLIGPHDSAPGENVDFRTSLRPPPFCTC